MKVSTFSTTIDQGCGWALGVHFRKPDGTPFDLSRGVTSFQIRLSARPSALPIAVPTSTSGGQAPGDCVFSLSSYKTAGLPTQGGKFSQMVEVFGEIDFAYSDDPKNPQRIGEGKILVSPGGNAPPDPTATDPVVAAEWTTLVVYGDRGIIYSATLDGGGPDADYSLGITLDGGGPDADYSGARILDGGAF
jgi:hypothetical protein